MKVDLDRSVPTVILSLLYLNAFHVTTKNLMLRHHCFASIIKKQFDREIVSKQKHNKNERIVQISGTVLLGYLFICCSSSISLLQLVQCENEVERIDEDEDGEGSWSDLGPDKETDCSLCLGFRKGPCGNYWRRQEACMDKYKYINNKDKLQSERNTEDADNKTNDSFTLPNWSEKCEKPFLVWTKCMKNNSQFYDSYFKKSEHENDKTILTRIPKDSNKLLVDKSKQDNDSRKIWHERLLSLEKVVNSTMGPPKDFPENLKPKVTFNTRNATGLITFPMQQEKDQHIIIGFVRDNNGELLGVGQRFELDRVKHKGTLEVGGISGFTEYIVVYALYEGRDGPLLCHKADLALLKIT